MKVMEARDIHTPDGYFVEEDKAPKGYIIQRKDPWGFSSEKTKIPNGFVKCPICKGKGEVRPFIYVTESKNWRWPEQRYVRCVGCRGVGCVSPEDERKLYKRYDGLHAPPFIEFRPLESTMRKKE